MPRPSFDPSAVDPTVMTVVAAWSLTADEELGRSALREARPKLTPAQLVELQAEISEITVEVLLDLVCKSEGVTEGETVEWFGFQLYPAQQLRVAAWAEEQRQLAAALGLDDDTWTKQLHRAIARYLETGARVGGEVDEAKKAAAQKLLGQGAQTFENRPELGTSKQAGLMGILAARQFQNPDGNG